MKSHLEKRLYSEQVRNLFDHSYTLVISHPIAGALLVSTFWDSADHTWMMLWLAALTTISVLRLPLFFGFKRNNQEVVTSRFWGRSFYVVSALQGSIYAVIFIFLVLSTPAHLHNIILLWIIGLSACAVVGYASDLKGLLSFFIPCVLPGFIVLSIVDGQTNAWIALGILLYSAVILKTVIPVHRSIVQAMRLNYQLEREVEIRRETEEKLHKLSIEDGLTGVFNRRFFDDTLLNEVKRAKRGQSALCLALIDIDHFKLYNDHYGHQKGDLCLQRVVAILKQGLHRNTDILARYGGEEFAIVLPNMSLAEAQKLVEKIRLNLNHQQVEHLKTTVDNIEYVTISAGLAELNIDKNESVDAFIERTDSALYHAKLEGRNRLSCATSL